MGVNLVQIITRKGYSEIMGNKIFYYLPCLVCGMLMSVSCKSPIPVQSSGEVLSSLSKVTDGENKCEYPFGGDNGKNLYFSVQNKGTYARNIYCKTDPFSASMSQKTAGKNHNMAPSYCALTNKIAYAGLQEGALNRDVYMIDATQSNALIQVTNTPGEDENYPCLSRDGRKVVYEKIVGGRVKDCQIWIKDLKTSEEKVLGPGRMPSFSPDGNQIVFVRYTDDGKNTCLWIMNADGSNTAQLTYAKSDVVWHPRFSPNGQQIVFQCAPKRTNKNFDLYIIDKNGNNLTQLTINKSYDGEPYWSNDGHIYFTSDRGGQAGRYQIWRFKYGSPVSSFAPVQPSYVEPQTYSQPAAIHVVSQGETISQIAKKYNVSVRDIVKWNGLQTMTLTSGMHLKVSAQ